MTTVLLSDHDIRESLSSGYLGLDPCDLSSLQPSSIDVRLDHEFRFYRPGTLIDPRRDQAEVMDYQYVAEDETFTLPPHGFALGATMEQVRMPDDLAARFEGKSSIGRLGLLPHVAAGFIDPGFQGWITLELHNVTDCPIVLLPGMKIGQLCFFRLSTRADIPYGSAGIGSRYQGQRGPTTSRYHLNYERAADPAGLERFTRTGRWEGEALPPAG